MDFFKSVFQDDPDPPETESDSDLPKNIEEHEHPEQSNPDNDDDDDSGWSFGGLIKTIATKSESVIETYRRDLEEFGTGLRKEIEVAQGSVGHVIDELGNTVIKSTAEIIAQGKEVILAVGNDESDSSDNNSISSSNRRDSFSSKPYSRFDAQVRAIQCDINTYCEDVEGDSDEYKKWECEFTLEGKDEEMEMLLEENGEMEGLYRRVVPDMVGHEVFWFRYFYKVYKLKQAEDLRANLVKRAIGMDDEEELSWDIDDEEENVEKVTKDVSEAKPVGDASPPPPPPAAASDEAVFQDSGKSEVVLESEEVSNVGLKTDTKTEEVSEAKPVVAALIQDSDTALESEEAVPSQDLAKVDVVVSSSTKQPLEEDVGWDEIEDMSGIDVKEEVRKSGGSPKRDELRKRLSGAEEDEDLSWDIEDDDEESSSTSKA